MNTLCRDSRTSSNTHTHTLSYCKQIKYRSFLVRTHISGIGKQEQTQDVKAHSIPRLYKYEPNDMRDKKENTVIQAGVYIRIKNLIESKLCSSNAELTIKNKKNLETMNQLVNNCNRNY